MRFGAILRRDHGGLAAISKDWWKWLRPDKALVVDIGEMPTDDGAISGPNCIHCQGAPTADHIREFLEDLDVVLCFETPYNWDLFDFARKRGIRTVLMVNWEYCDDRRYALSEYHPAGSAPSPINPFLSSLPLRPRGGSREINGL